MNDKPKITFPCEYPIKIIGKASANFDAEVITAINPFLTKPYDGIVQQRDSRQMNFISITVTINAQSEQQIRDIFEALKQLESVIMVL